LLAINCSHAQFTKEPSVEPAKRCSNRSKRFERLEHFEQ
jgi:hypothetical protein